jgi:hypothetical protein
MGKKYLLGGVLIIFALTFSMWFLGCSERKEICQSTSAHDLLNEKSKITYSVLNENVLDAPIKTQIELSILVSGEITESNLRELINKLYVSISNRKGFKFHQFPTNIYIYAFISRKYYESGMGQWIAMLEKNQASTESKILINSNQLGGLNVKSEEKFGLSVQQRKAIWDELIKAEDRAWAEAENAYPSNLDAVRGMSREQIKIQLDRHFLTEEALKEGYKDRLSKKYNLTKQQLKEIALEGLEKDWAMPPF